MILTGLSYWFLNQLYLSQSNEQDYLSNTDWLFHKLHCLSSHLVKSEAIALHQKLFIVSWFCLLLALVLQLGLHET